MMIRSIMFIFICTAWSEGIMNIIYNLHFNEVKKWSVKILLFIEGVDKVCEKISNLIYLSHIQSALIKQLWVKIELSYAIQKQ